MIVTFDGVGSTHLSATRVGWLARFVVVRCRDGKLMQLEQLAVLGADRVRNHQKVGNLPE